MQLRLDKLGVSDAACLFNAKARHHCDRQPVRPDGNDGRLVEVRPVRHDLAEDRIQEPGGRLRTRPALRRIDRLADHGVGWGFHQPGLRRADPEERPRRRRRRIERAGQERRKPLVDAAQLSKRSAGHGPRKPAIRTAQAFKELRGRHRLVEGPAIVERFNKEVSRCLP